MAKSGLEGDGSPIAGCLLLSFRGRDGNERLAFSRVWVVQEGTEGPLLGAAQPRQEYHTVLASMSVEGMGPSLAVEGATPPPGSSKRTWSGYWHHLRCAKLKWW
jgi:hypothetical protein